VVALPTEPRVADNPRASRCGLWLGATRTGLIEYRTEPGVGVHRPHRCRPAFAGQWLGERLVAGAKADGWSVSAPYVPLEQLRSLNNILTASAEEAGRDPERIVRLYNLMGLITPDGRGMFNGPVGRWVDTLTTLYSEYQMNTFIFWPSGDRERQSRIFAEEVVPPARQALASATG
jgi:hypothetical protein